MRHFSDRAMQNATTPSLILERRAIIEINIHDTDDDVYDNKLICLLACAIALSLTACIAHISGYHIQLHCHNFIDVNLIILLSRIEEYTLTIGIMRQSKSIFINNWNYRIFR